ncbi:MAG TPA: multicopper oxidase domain-containing protein [Burkholderiaceae bacterium]|nr:multicopper oxidase domain-containing protein [Burkholderiaceae bacterium]
MLRSTVAAAAASLGLPALGTPSRPDDTAGAGPAARPARIDVHLELHAGEDAVALRPGAPTRVWRYRATLLRGDPAVLEAMPHSYLGPVIRLRRHQRVRIDFVNDLPESTIVHWHGLHLPAAMDGHPRDAIAPGSRFVYEFTVVDRAGSYWFHPHPDGRTGKQVWFGLAGLLLIGDDEEDRLGLPSGRHDLPLVIQDRSFDDDNQFVYLGQRIGDPQSSAAGAAMSDGRTGGMMGRMGPGGMMGRGRSGMGEMMAGMMGVLGDEILVNGRRGARVAVEARPYRLRLLNASNTRICKLAWNDGSRLTAIASDGGLLAAPLQRDYLVLGPAERADLWVDFGHWPAGTELTLQSLAFEGGMPSMGGMGGMMGAMMGSAALPDGAAFPVLELHINGKAEARSTPPQRLSNLPPPDPRRVARAGAPKVFDITMGMMRWGINGRSFEMEGVSPLETVKLGTDEVWEFRNGASMMPMAHSMHVHGLQFRVLGRSDDGSAPGIRKTVEAGYLDEGWKDTVLVMPGERVRILLRFTDFSGLFIYHCHMLEHEDSGLMRNYLVQA